MKDFNVLITGCSRFSKELIDSLKNNEDGVKVKVVGVDCNPNHLLHTGVDWSYVVPTIYDPEYIPTLINVCKKHDVNVILPYITRELELMAANKHRFEEYYFKVSISSVESINVANDKVAMWERFSRYMPQQTFATGRESIMSFALSVGYPINKLCCKLTNRCGGLGFAIVDEEKANDITLFNKSNENRYVTLEQLCTIVDENKDVTILLQNYIPGLDYSVCVLADKGESLVEVGYVGNLMSYGSVVNGEIVKHDEAYRIAREVTKELGLDGNACFDFIIDGEKAVLLEVNPRINASIPFVAKAGANLPYLRCKQLLGYELPKEFNIKYGMKMNRYYESEYFF